MEKEEFYMPTSCHLTPKRLLIIESPNENIFTDCRSGDKISNIVCHLLNSLPHFLILWYHMKEYLIITYSLS